MTHHFTHAGYNHANIISVSPIALSNPICYIVKFIQAPDGELSNELWIE